MITNQAQLFLIFIIDGILIGLLFDLFRIARKVIHTSDFVTYIEDIIFWILAGMIVLYSIFIFNNGELRLFMFLGIILGAILYMLLLSSHIIKINVKIINIIKRILKTIFIPFKFMYKLISKFLLKPFTFLIINIRRSFTNFGTKIYKNSKISKKEKML